MGSRRGTVYEERDFYEERRGPPAPVRTRERDYEEVDIYSSRREREPDRRPDFLREDYERRDAGQVVVRERETDVYTRPLERRPRSPSPVRIRERVIQREISPPIISENLRSRTRIVERRSPSPPPERLRARVIETRERVRERSPSPAPVRVRERIIEREREKSLSPPPIERIRVRNFERETRQPTPSPSSSPSPPPSIRAPPIHQEIITHHRHIDHGFEIAQTRVPTPPPPARRSEPRTKETDVNIYTSRNNTEVDITRRESTRAPAPAPRERSRSRHRSAYDDTYIYEQERDRLRVSDREIDIRRSASARPERQIEKQRDFSLNIRDEDESDYYARKVDERAYIGEAYNGATKNWAIVDVPPGTERVQLDGVGGASQEITWQKYNGVRRSKFIPERERERIEIREDSRRGETIERDRIEIRDERPRERETIERERIEIRDDRPSRETGLEIEISRKERHPSSVYERYEERVEEVTDRRVGPSRGPKQRDGDLWTEITKDLVVREAIEQMGYDFEETEYFYYIIQYLRYEDVLQLVELSETIKRERQRRVREIERERDRLERREREREEWERRERRRERDSRDSFDERIVEREVVYDNGPRRRY